MKEHYTSALEFRSENLSLGRSTKKSNIYLKIVNLLCIFGSKKNGCKIFLCLQDFC